MVIGAERPTLPVVAILLDGRLVSQRALRWIACRLVGMVVVESLGRIVRCSGMS